MNTITTGEWEEYVTFHSRKAAIFLLINSAIWIYTILKEQDILSLPFALQFCAVLGSFLPIFAYLIVLELSQSHNAALITATLLIFGE